MCLGIVFVAFAVLVALGVNPALNGEPLAFEFMLFSLVPGAGLAAVVTQWVTNKDGVPDYKQGGVVGMRNSAGSLSWYDWAIFMTRKGTVYKQSGTLVLERRLFFGLIPLGTKRHPLAEFYRVKLDAQDVERAYGDNRNRGMFGSGGRTTYVVRVDYSLSLVNRAGDKLVVLDLSASPGSEISRRFMGRLHEALEDLVGHPGRRRANRPKRDAGGEDLESWRKEQGGG